MRWKGIGVSPGRATAPLLPLPCVPNDSIDVKCELERFSAARVRAMADVAGVMRILEERGHVSAAPLQRLVSKILGDRAFVSRVEELILHEDVVAREAVVRVLRLMGLMVNQEAYVHLALGPYLAGERVLRAADSADDAVLLCGDLPRSRPSGCRG